MAEEKIRLVRISRIHRYRVVTCCSTHKLLGNTYRIELTDQGRWQIECEECGASMELSDLLELGNVGE